jgi:hypothetical protein
MRSDEYFAGLIDGEAYPAIEFRGKGKGFRPVIEVGMASKKTLDACRKHFNVGTVLRRKKLKNRKQQWRWRVTYNGARLVARRVLPFSITKRRELQKIANYKPKG